MVISLQIYRLKGGGFCVCACCFTLPYRWNLSICGLCVRLKRGIRFFCVSGSLLFCLQIPLKTCFPVWITWALGCFPLENSDFGYHCEILFSVIVGKRLYLGTKEKQHSQKLLCQCEAGQVDFGLLTPLEKKRV